MSLPFLLLFALSTATAAFAITTTLPGCPTRCGDLTIPFPFGTQAGCHLPGFLLTCNRTFSPPRAFINTTDIQVASLSASASTATILTPIARQCNDRPATATNNLGNISLDLTGLPYAISNSRNKFTALGCSTMAFIQQYDSLIPSCVTICEKLSSVINGTCSGMGCCQTAIPPGQRFVINVEMMSDQNNTWNFSPCSYAFLVDKEYYKFKVSDLGDFYKKDRVPVLLEWAVGNNESCEAAASSAPAWFLCGENTLCTNSKNAVVGYLCSCQTGYDGNPYLPNSCQDINECVANNPCTDRCENTPGSYICSCPRGYIGDGNKTGNGCTKRASKFQFLQVVVGCGIGLVFFLPGFYILYYLL